MADDDLITEYLDDEVLIYDKTTHVAYCLDADRWHDALPHHLTRRQALAALLAAGGVISAAIPPPAAAQSLPTLCVSNCGTCHQRGMACCHTSTLTGGRILRSKLKLCVATCSPADCNDTILQAANCGTTVTACS